MKLHNTLTKQTEKFVPTDPNNVKIYTCGPTVYSYQHIGNYAAYVYWDILIRALRLNGWQANRVLNITDVGHLSSDADEGEDKLEKGAKREGKSVWDIAGYYTDDFLQNFRALGLIEPTKITKATDYIEAQINLLKILTEKGYTYETSDGIYYDTSRFPRYADFARLDLENLKAGARVEYSSEKRNPSDFALWKFVREGEDHAMQWDYLGRAGYPGWHLECSAIIHAELGEPIDIHTGGIEHIMIHHTNEIAQSEAAFDVSLSRFWLHNNHLTIDGQKISKSEGNTLNFKDLEANGYTHVDFRMWVIEGHYQSERNFSWESIEAAKQRLLRYRNWSALRHQKTGNSLRAISGDDKEGAPVESVSSKRGGRLSSGPEIPEGLSQFFDGLNNNLSTPEALASLDSMLSDDLYPTNETLDFLDQALGLQLAASTPDISDGQKQLIENRNQARTAQDWSKSDQLRSELEQSGITILDTKDGSVWQYK